MHHMKNGSTLCLKNSRKEKIAFEGVEQGNLDFQWFSKKEIANGFMIQDFDLLLGTVSKFAMCKTCKRAK